MAELTHWKKLNNPDYLGAYSITPGEDLIATIKSVVKQKVKNPEGKEEICSVMHFMEDIKPMILNVTNAKTISKIYKTPYVEQWAGKKIQIYATEVKAFGEMTEALRIRPYPPKEETPICTECGQAVKAFRKLTAQQVAQYGAQEFGRIVCSECGQKLRKQKAAEAAAKTTAETPAENMEVSNGTEQN